MGNSNSAELENCTRPKFSIPGEVPYTLLKAVTMSLVACISLRHSLASMEPEPSKRKTASNGGRRTAVSPQERCGGQAAAAVAASSPSTARDASDLETKSQRKQPTLSQASAPSQAATSPGGAKMMVPPSKKASRGNPDNAPLSSRTAGAASHPRLGHSSATGHPSVAVVAAARPRNTRAPAGAFGTLHHRPKVTQPLSSESPSTSSRPREGRQHVPKDFQRPPAS
mmetsp:Transcript_20681/g.57141  ORF Transcript_20681/g.57141 Transcript_20681/m.57141 type:complete len:226 (+) Transcript_20681:478-1155(+)